MSKPWVPAVLLLALFLGALLAAAPVEGQTLCDDLIVDEANLFGAGLSRVEAAALELVRAGADVRVRTFRTFGSAGNLDQLEAQLERECASWRAPDGSRKNNLIVIMVAQQERATGLFYGSQWESTLGQSWLRIQTEVMNPRFRDGDFKGGFVNGLREIRRSMTQEVSAPGGGASLPWQVPVAAIAALAAAVAALIGYRAIVTRRRNAAKRRAAWQRARQAQQEAASLVNSLGEAVESLEIRIGSLAGMCSAEDARPLAARLEEAKRLRDAVAEEYSKARQTLGDLDNGRLSEDSFRAMEETYRKMLSSLREAEAAKDDLAKQVSQLQELVVQLPTDLAAAEGKVKDAEDRFNAVREKGFRTGEAERLLAGSRQPLAQAGALLQERQLLTAAERLKEAEDLVAQAIQSAEDLPRQKQEAEKGIPALAQRLVAIKAAIAAGRECFDRISASYPESNWESIWGNGTEAEKRVDGATQSLEEARSAATLERQEWPRALELLREANTWLDQAESLMRSIAALEASLAAARRDAPQEIAAARSDIAKAWEYIEKYDEDIRESLEDELREAETKLKTAQDELATARPDYPRALKLAQEANAAADRILEAARSEHEAAERLRAKAASALRDARAAVSKIEEYVEDHGIDIKERATGLFQAARSHLQEAETTTDLSIRVSRGQEAESAAEAAYAAAREDVRRAEEARSRRYVPARGGFPRGPWGPPSRHRGGGSIGHGSRGGGGSTGWGVGRGGGGSTRW